MNLITLTYLQFFNHRIISLTVMILALGCGRASHQKPDQGGSDKLPPAEEPSSDVRPSSGKAENNQLDEKQIISIPMGTPHNQPTEGMVSDPGDGQKETSLNPLKYPAAIMIECGNGKADLFQTRSQQPLWRVYICLGTTDSKQQGRLELNLNDLGTPITQTWTFVDSGEISSIVKLHKLSLNYSYISRFDRTPFGHESGLVSIQMSSEQDWESRNPDSGEISRVLLSKQNRFQLGSNASYINLFDLETSDGTLFMKRIYNYTSDGDDFYVTVNLERALSTEKKEENHIISACENTDQTLVWEIIAK